MSIKLYSLSEVLRDPEGRPVIVDLTATDEDFLRYVANLHEMGDFEHYIYREISKLTAGKDYLWRADHLARALDLDPEERRVIVRGRAIVDLVTDKGFLWDVGYSDGVVVLGTTYLSQDYGVVFTKSNRYHDDDDPLLYVSSLMQWPGLVEFHVSNGTLAIVPDVLPISGVNCYTTRPRNTQLWASRDHPGYRTGVIQIVEVTGPGDIFLFGETARRNGYSLSVDRSYYLTSGSTLDGPFDPAGMRMSFTKPGLYSITAYARVISEIDAKPINSEPQTYYFTVGSEFRGTAPPPELPALNLEPEPEPTPAPPPTDSTLGQTLQIRTATLTAGNTHGVETREFETREVQGVLVDVPSAKESAETYGLYGQTVDYVLYFPPGESLQHTDQVEIAGDWYEVVGFAPPITNFFTNTPFRTEVKVRKIRG